MTNETSAKLDELLNIAEKNNYIQQDYYTKYNVKRGLRNENGAGVLVGLTQVGEVHGYIVDEGEKIPSEGRLNYRGINIKDITNGFLSENRFGFEEVIFLLLFGKLPNKEQIQDFNKLLGSMRSLPFGFTEDMILKAPSKDIMNKLQRSILVSYSYDNNPDDLSVENVLRQSIELIARFPAFIAYGYQAKIRYYDGKSLFLHSPDPLLSTAENILHMIRSDNQYTHTEAQVLDLCMVLHAEHGGGNNSAFATHVVSSTGTDTYSAIATAVGSLKGPKHGGANIKVMQMMDYIKDNISDWNDEAEIEAILRKILQKEAFDNTGLIYGIGHAVYTISDPRAEILREKAKELAIEKNRLDEYKLYRNIEQISIKLFANHEKNPRPISANVDFYSGFVYDMLNIPREMYTPLFAAARVTGWCAHRIEQLVSEPRIIRPAYKSVSKKEEYEPLDTRTDNNRQV
ncbi:citrate/2-methylcitrate synthase [Clostridium sp. DJ247]|uniref:citrate/2-methylcitrate synthase n=1 Tax=Clostridium sp. DJ247 TaxID=2726188 RepID=UPI0016275649|nr:citrate/2-methylcitrate synthase [Clostridium sp. DJ247]MBC2579200.1 citrate/2-methylcitrate synthase [Clostridium sp. DJ247]